MERKEIDRTFGGNVIPIRTRFDAVRYGDAWANYADRMQMLYEIACIQRDMSEALLQDAYREIERLKGLL